MGEAKRKRERLSPVEQRALDLTHKLANEGKLIAGGFAAWCLTRKVDPASADADLLLAHDAYMAGSEHLWTSIMATLDAGIEPTDADLKRMDLIHAEIEAWRTKKKADMAQSYPTQGSA